MKREVTSRCIMNILDVKHTYNYEIFSTKDLYNVLLEYGKELYDETQYNAYQLVIQKHRSTIDTIALDQPCESKDYNAFMEDLRIFKRNYVLNKKN